MTNLFRCSFTLLTLLLCLAGGCAKRIRVPIEDLARVELPAPAIKKLAGSKKISSIRALAEMELDYMGREKRFDIAMAAKSPDSIRLEFIDPLAGSVLTIVSTPRQLVYIDSSGVFFYGGDEASKIFRKTTGLPWSPEEVIRIFRGRLPSEVSLTSKYPKDKEGRFWIDDGVNALAWNDDQKLLNYLEMGNRKADTTIEYSDYKREKKIDYPSRIKIMHRRPKTRLNLHYKDVEFNVRLKPQVFETIIQ